MGRPTRGRFDRERDRVRATSEAMRASALADSTPHFASVDSAALRVVAT